MSGRWLRMAPERQFHAVAHDVVLIRLDGQRVLRVQRLQPALRHAERVVAEIDLSGLLVQLVHREVGDPAEPERALLDQAEFFGRAACAPRRRISPPLRSCPPRRTPRRRLEPARRADRLGAVGFEVARDRPLRHRPRRRRCSPARRRPRRCAHSFSLSKKLRGCAAAPGAGMARTTPP